MDYEVASDPFLSKLIIPITGRLRQMTAGGRSLLDLGLDTHELQPERLGGGSFGEVYRCVVTDDVAAKLAVEPGLKLEGGCYAIKKISTVDPESRYPSRVNHLSSDTYLEAATLRAARHPSITKLHAAYVDPNTNTSYLILELGDENLSQYHRSLSDQMQIKMVAEILYQILLGVTHMHTGGPGGKQVMHCDLKPSNILLKLNQHGRPKDVHYVRICDFGMAQATPATPYVSRSPRGVGTKIYCPPEIILGQRDYFSAVDIWAVGCIFGELLTGRLLFAGEHPEVLRLDEERETLVEIARAFGKPTNRTWKGVERLDNYEQMMEGFDGGEEPQDGCTLKDMLKSADPPRQDMDAETEALAIDLLESLLKVNPTQRITGPAALRHPFFERVLGLQVYQYASYMEGRQPSTRLNRPDNYRPQHLRTIEHDKHRRFTLPDSDFFATHSQQLLTGDGGGDGGGDIQLPALRARLWDRFVCWNDVTACVDDEDEDEDDDDGGENDLSLGEDGIATAINMVDRYVYWRYQEQLVAGKGIKPLTRYQYLVTGVVCLSLAYMNDHCIDDIDEECEGFQSGFAGKQDIILDDGDQPAPVATLKAVQSDVLRVLDFAVYYPSPFRALRRYGRAVQWGDESVKEYVIQKATILMYLSFGYHVFVSLSPAQLATMCAHCAIRIARNDTHIKTPANKLDLWPRELADESAIAADSQLRVLWDNMKRLLAKIAKKEGYTMSVESVYDKCLLEDSDVAELEVLLKTHQRSADSSSAKMQN
ncbi:unnamed protein product [Vitrella brassicaformis CCMP3155]|uniref:Protein kinase domain-containing protein n=1 Tax=Vitrella brassicaformis (strain CCMP3155) TaxID=1169540 RepID=A0A0G4GE50_VITBC|nr:unnamed protein product [Vitrella brassicaformis CCMP3155]|eukprot:CEM27640.1 unnamed protein product [Vitrella brassicaformis CCMP3155]